MLELTIRLFAPDQFYRATADSGFALAAQPRIEIDGEKSNCFSINKLQKRKEAASS